MNNRIMTALFALTLCLCLFIGVVPVEADATTVCSSHVWKEVAKIEPTCGTKGTEAHRECRQCGVWAFSGTNTVCTTQGKKSLEIPKLTEHTPSEWLTSDAKHWKECTVCETVLEAKENHKQITVDNEDGKTHRDVCETCGYVIAASNPHDLKKTKNADGTHTIECNYCEYKVENEAHVDADKNCKCDVCGFVMHDFSAYQKNSDGKTHIKACANSGCDVTKPGETWEEHKFVGFKANGDGSHSAECEVCGYVSKDTMRCSAYDKNGDHICDDCGGRVGHVYGMTAYMEGVVERDATCSEVGYKETHNKCKVCGIRMNSAGKILLDEEVVIPKLAHKYVWYKDNTEKHWQYCENWATCEAENLNEAEHTISYVSGTDSNAGKHYATCKVCGWNSTVWEDCEDIEGDGKCECKCGYKIPHVLSNTKLVELKLETCTSNGNVAHRLCEECGGTFGLKKVNGALPVIRDVVIKATGHDYVVNETRGDLHDVTCTKQHSGKDSDGNDVDDTCAYADYVGHQDTTGDCRCDLVETTGKACGAPLHTHSYRRMPAVAATCQSEGVEEYWYFYPCNRMFSDDTFTAEIKAPVKTAKTACTPGAWTNEGDEHVKTCTVCGQIAEHAAHVDANSDNRCEICLFELALEYHAEIPATCTANGTKAYYESKVTHRKYWDAEGTKFIDGNSQSDLIIPKLNHIDPVTGVGPAATDLGNGKHELKCALCDTITKTEAHTTGGCFCAVCGAGASADHKATTYAYQAPVCDKDGHEAYAKCSCGKYYNALGVETTYQKLVIKATGHTWGAEIFNDDSKGEHYAVCEICGKKNYGEHSLTAKDPLSGNYHQFICECGEVTLEKHYDKNGDKVCDEQGCKHDMSGEEVDVYEHKGTTVETGDKKTNPLVSWLNNWLNRTEPSTGGGSTQTQQPSNPVGPGTSSGSGSQGGSDNGGSTSDNGGGSDNGGSGNGGGSSNNQNDSSETAGLLQQLAGFLNWILTSLGF